MHACTLLNYSRLALNALFSELKIKLYFPEFWSEFWILARILADFWILARILAEFWILARILDSGQNSGNIFLNLAMLGFL